MKLLFKKPHKSIRSFEGVELPDFVVLTGVNGAGKSHLLEALEMGAINFDGVAPNPVNGPRLIRRFDANSLITQDTGAFYGGQILQEVGSHWDQIRSFWFQASEAFYAKLRTFLPIDVEKMSLGELWALDSQRLVALGVPEENAEVLVGLVRSSMRESEENIIRQFNQGDSVNRPRLVREMKGAKDIPLIAFSQDEFFQEFPANWQQVDLFQHSFSRLFSNYQRAWRENELRARGQEKGENVTPLTTKEFLARHGEPPWDFLNGLLEVANLDFRISEPFKWEDRPYEPVLHDAKRGLNVKFGELSSGERILMSFALCLYHTKDARANVEYPKVLLFDEIDAPLHPSMTSSLLKTIKQALVVERGIKVILTTHSPSTVALAPEDSIYVMHKAGPRRVEAVSRDAALGILTEGVPTLSVNFENRRQVFVESNYDVSFYSDLYQLCKSRLMPEISISFIASGGGGNDGNCDQVIKISSILRGAGNRTVIGLVDWDLKNKTSADVFVLGEERYAIDNYILDPIAVGLLLIREVIKFPEDFGFSSGENYFAIGQAGSEVLMRVADRVISDVLVNLKDEEKGDQSKIDFSYAEGFSIKVPKCLAILQGHRLEEVLKDTYPQLQRYRKEPDLKRDVISKVFADRPGLIPVQIVNIMKNIQQIR